MDKILGNTYFMKNMIEDNDALWAQSTVFQLAPLPHKASPLVLCPTGFITHSVI